MRVCISLCTTVIHNTTQHRIVLIIFTLNLQMNVTALTLSTGGEGSLAVRKQTSVYQTKLTKTKDSGGNDKSTYRMFFERREICGRLKCRQSSTETACRRECRIARRRLESQSVCDLNMSLCLLLTTTFHRPTSFTLISTINHCLPRRWQQNGNYRLKVVSR